MSTVTIGRPKDTYKDDWIAMWPDYSANPDNTPSSSICDVIWARVMDPAQSPHAYFAYDKSGRLIGFLHYVLHSCTWVKEPYCYLADAYVLPKHRKKGVFSALYAALSTEAETEKWHKIYWITRPDNKAGQAVYDKIAKKTNWIRYEHKMNHEQN